jgi:hypothetical protein
MFPSDHLLQMNYLTSKKINDEPNGNSKFFFKCNVNNTKYTCNALYCFRNRLHNNCCGDTLMCKYSYNNHDVKVNLYVVLSSHLDVEKHEFIKQMVIKCPVMSLMHISNTYKGHYVYAGDVMMGVTSSLEVFNYTCTHLLCLMHSVPISSAWSGMRNGACTHFNCTVPVLVLYSKYSIVLHVTPAFAMVPFLSTSGVRRHRPSSCCWTYCWQTPFTHQPRTCLIIIIHTWFQSPLYHRIYTPSPICLCRSLQMLFVFLRGISSTISWELYILHFGFALCLFVYAYIFWAQQRLCFVPTLFYGA